MKKIYGNLRKPAHAAARTPCIDFLPVIGTVHTHFRIRHEHVHAEERFTVALSELSSMACLQKYTPRKNSDRKNSTVRN
jgi:hypothetical protein